MNFLFVLHDPPYGTERVYNGLRWADHVAQRDNEVRVFLFGDAVVAAMAKQKTPEGYYNTEKMIASLIRHGGQVGSCTTCLHARGIGEDMISTNTHLSSMSELTDWTLWADKVINV
jgi:uncharacterized protein involved in oxidation of intracellular sulfur